MFLFKKKTEPKASEPRRTQIIEGEVASNAYYYLRNRLLHVKYSVDKCIDLTELEDLKIKEELAQHPYLKQDILRNNWDMLTRFEGKEVLNDGVAEGFHRSQELTQKYRKEHGHTN